MKRILVLMLLGFVVISVAEARQFGDVTIPDTIEAGGQRLLLNGAGYRTKYFMKMYIGGLYLKQENNDAASIISADEPMLIKLHIVSGRITSARMTEAINEGFENSAGASLASLTDKIARFQSFFAEDINVGDIFDIGYVPGEGVSVHKNGSLSGTIEGTDFKKAVFGIWLGEKPADKGLKKNMLGGD